MSNAYCGIGNVPKGKKRGSMKDCAEQGQIRYFGIKKIDSRLIEASKKMGRKSSRNTLLKQFGTLKGKLNNLQKNIKYEKDTKKKEQMKKDIDKFSKDLTDVNKQLRALSRVSRSHSLKRSSKRQSSRKHSSRKHSSRRGSKHHGGSRKHGNRKHGSRKHGSRKHSSRKHSSRKHSSRKHSNHKQAGGYYECGCGQ